MERNTVILSTIAKALNAGGSAIVSALDGGAEIFNCTMSALSPGEKSKLRCSIKTLEKKIQVLYVEIGKESAKFSDPTAALESVTVRAILSAIKELTSDIENLKLRIVELETTKAAPAKPELKKVPQASVGVVDFFIKSITGSISGYLPGEKSTLERTIAANDKKIQVLYGDFARESAKQPDPAAALASAAVAAIIASINELKAENESLKLRINELSPVKKMAVKAQPAVPAAKSPDCAVVTTPVTPVEVPAVARVPEPAEVAGEQSDPSTVDYTRAKPCLIPTPSLQPPTRVDIENDTRGLVPDIAEEAISTTPEVFVAPLVEVAVAEEPSLTAVEAVEAVAEAVGEEQPEPSVEAVVEPVVEVHVGAVIEAAAEEHEAPVEAEATTIVLVLPEVERVATVDEPPAAEVEPSGGGVTEEVPPVETPTAQEEQSAGDEAVSERLATSDRSDISVPEPPVPVEAIIENTQELPHSDVPLPELEKKKIWVAEKPEAGKSVWGDVAAATVEFSKVRSRSHTASFTVLSEPRHEFSVAEHSLDTSVAASTEPVFRTRVHQNTFSAVSATAATLSVDNNSSPIKIKGHTKAEIPVYTVIREAVSEAGPVFRARVHPTAFAGVSGAVAVLTGEDAVVENSSVAAEEKIERTKTAPKKNVETLTSAQPTPVSEKTDGKKSKTTGKPPAGITSKQNKPAKRS